MTNLSRSFSSDKFFVTHEFSSWYVRSWPNDHENDSNMPPQAENNYAVHILRIAKVIIRETSTAKSRNHTDVRRIYPIDIPIGDIIVSILR